jgi:hypothetical protein
MTTQKSIWSLLLAGAVLTSACGDSKSSLNPVAPSAVVIGAQSDQASTADAVSSTTGKGGNGGGKPDDPGNGNGGGGNGNGGGGNGNGGGGNGNGGGGNGNQPTVPPGQQPPSNTSPTAPTAPGLKKVEIEGLISAKGGDSITVNGQTVVVPSACPIRHGNTSFTFADLKVGDRVHVRASRNTTGSGATAATTLEATDVKLQNPGSGGDGDDEDPTSLVSVSATDALASETAGNTGTFRLTRAGTPTQQAAALTVTFTLSGTAGNGVDYQNLPVTAMFAANQATVDVVVTPLADGTAESPESVILTLTGASPYELGSPLSATVTITDTEGAALVSVTAFDSTASESGPDLGTFRFARTGGTTASLTVVFTVTGTATNGSDYQGVPLTVTFGVGQATSDLFVIPLPDGTAEGLETVTVTVTDGATYDVGAPASATVTIAG